jgi:hypothetical protein
MAIKYTKWTEILPNGHSIYQHLPLQDPLKFTQIGIFSLKIHHLATLMGDCQIDDRQNVDFQIVTIKMLTALFNVPLAYIGR